MKDRFNIVDLFFEAAAKYPGKLAIIDKNSEITFSELAQEVKNTSGYFLGKGIGKGDRVLLFVPMSIDLYRIVLALFNIGATVVFLDEWVSRKRMDECCKIALCKGFIGVWKAKLLLLFSSELRKIPIRLGVDYKITQTDIAKANVLKTDTALITFTTGSTGIPKAAKRTHGFLYEQFNALNDEITPHPEDVDMPALPIVLLISLGAGCTSVIADFKASKPNSLNGEKIVRQMIKHNVTCLEASPFFIKTVANYLIDRKLTVPSLKKVITGGAPVFLKEAEIYNRAFPEAVVKILYGSTEAEPISSILVKDMIGERAASDRGVCVGVPYFKSDVKIIQRINGPIQLYSKNELDEHTMPPEQIGEIIVSGSHVLQEYFNNEAAFKLNKIFIGTTCWHRTGDSGFVTREGVLYLTGRCTMLIDTKNEIISPFVYENRLQLIEGVEMGTVIKVNDKITLVLETIPESDRTHISKQAKSTNLKFDDIKFLQRIPRDPRHNSKIEYERLKIILE